MTATQNFTDFLTDPLGLNRFKQKANVQERQEAQWQAAHTALDVAGQSLVAENYEAAIASALVGLLSLQLSRT